MKPHVHAELIKAWADGAEIEYRVKDAQKCWGGWQPFENIERFLTDPWWEYRIKPKEPKPDVVRYAKALLVKEELQFKHFFEDEFEPSFDNLKLTFDGETGKLKSAEVRK